MEVGSGLEVAAVAVAVDMSPQKKDREWEVGEQDPCRSEEAPRKSRSSDRSPIAGVAVAIRGSYWTMRRSRNRGPSTPGRHRPRRERNLRHRS
jgi:hypothetical protein